MPKLYCDNREILLAPGQTVLDALLAAGVNVSHSCRSGVCQTCLVRAVEGSPPAQSQKGLKESHKLRGCFLACGAVPEEDLKIVTGDQAIASVAARVVSIDRLSDDVTRLRLQPTESFDYRSGQFLHLVRPDGLARSYSIASLHGRDPHLELHIRQIPGGRMSQWVAQHARPGDQLKLRGPDGECFYLPGKLDQPLLLVGTGTGLAPLYGILQDALRHHHTGPITLLHGALEARGLYLVDELLELAGRHPNLAYTRCLMNGQPAPGVEIGAIDQLVARRFPMLKGCAVYLCGHPDLVNKLKKKAYLAGADLKDIHADAFVMSSAG